MKIGNVTITPNEDFLVLPRPGDDIVFRALAVDSLEEFEAMCPMPEAPGVRKAGGFERDKKDPAYRALVEVRNEQRMHYLVIRSLECNEIEWDNVDVTQPATWKNWSDELKAAGLSDVECGRVVTCVLNANSLNEAKVQEAIDSFLLGRDQ